MQFTCRFLGLTAILSRQKNINQNLEAESEKPEAHLKTINHKLSAKIPTMIRKVIQAILGDPNEKEVKRLMKKVELINAEEEKLKALSDEDIQNKTQEFKDRLQNGETVDDIMIEAFAVVKNACRRICGKTLEMEKQTLTWNMVPYDVQLVGAMVLHEGKIAEMKTGEGKTLVASMPVYLNALEGKGVHVVTVNDYLAQRDAMWIGLLYSFLGLTVGTITHNMSPEERKAAYNCDITYGTNNEFGFDYLRDNMTLSLDKCVQRDLHYAIVDEVDSILIDEARTPLIISAPAEESTQKYWQYSQMVRQLKDGEHYEVDEKMKTAILTEEGIKKMEELLNVKNIYTEKGFREVHHIEQALKAYSLFKKDTDYVVREEEVIIVDEFTGRLMPGRRYSDGLHQAIEAKENVEVKRESRTLATITFQNYFRLYNKLSGMTGTAETEAEEFGHIYALDVVVIPTNRPIARDDKTDAIYKSEKGKLMAVAKTVKEKHAQGQPTLIGTISIERSEMISKLLEKEGVAHNVLNAKHHKREAEIVAQAGQKGAVTIATNMAGRGTDIKLGEGVADLGGLCIIGTERHESRRIDNQLRGRAGRQGDAGESQFYISMEDSLMRLFGAERIQKMMQFLNIPEDMPIENGMITRGIENAQKKVEGHHFDIRKHLVEYDDVMNRQREIVYKRRRRILGWEVNAQNTEVLEEIRAEIMDIIEKEIESIVLNHTQNRTPAEWDLETIASDVRAIYHDHNHTVSKDDLKNFSESNDVIEYLTKYLRDAYEAREKTLPDSMLLRQLEKNVYLRTIDTLWMEHIDEMSHLRESVSFRGYAQRDPLLEYKNDAFIMFQRLLGAVERNTINTLFKVEWEVKTEIKRPEPVNMQTNEDVITDTVTGSSPMGKGNVTTIKADSPSSDEPKVGRNDPCPCGSGKKYKKCHGVNS